MKIKDILKQGIEILKENNIENCSLKARQLLAKIINKSKEYIMIHDEDELNEQEKNEFWNKIERLKNNEPIQYILNSQEFMGFEFYVDSNVLIPQPDTEILVEEVIEIFRKNNKKMRILDLCTGSGAIGIALSKILKNTEVLASDISDKALEIAKKNAQKNCTKIDFIKSDLFEQFIDDDKFDIIVSNPPYIKTEVIKDLSKEVKYEPMIALDGGKNGLVFYKKIIEQASQYLNSQGYIALEIGYDQKDEVMQLLRNENYINIYSKKDLGGNDRVVVAQIP